MSDFVDEISDKFDVVMLCRFGSHLYGTDTPESDTDYKGIFMPTEREIKLGKIRKTANFDSNPFNVKNSKDDIDCELYSIHYFIELCIKGEMVAMDMLHANEENIIMTGTLWEDISNRRSMFYTTYMKAFVGYAKKQSAKYGMKSARLKSAESMMSYLAQFPENDRMFEHWHDMPNDENMYHKKQPDGGVSLKCMEFKFCGKTIQSTAKVGYIYDMVGKFYDSYGHRARKAQANEGVDWKAISHTLRGALQMEEIYRTGDLQFPLDQAQLVTNVKRGVHTFNRVLNEIECVLKRVDALAAESLFPAEVDREKAEDLLIALVDTAFRHRSM
jgi:hypothetical protein